MSKSKILTAHGKRQKAWLSDELLHSSPRATMCTVSGKIGAQLEHPKGGPLGWVQSPFGEDTLGVFRNDDGKWQWRIKEEYALVETAGEQRGQMVVFTAAGNVGKSKCALDVKLYSQWKHTRTGRTYCVTKIVNQHTSNPKRYPVTVVYVDTETGYEWCRPLAKWHDSMELI